MQKPQTVQSKSFKGWVIITLLLAMTACKSGDFNHSSIIATATEKNILYYPFNLETLSAYRSHPISTVDEAIMASIVEIHTSRLRYLDPPRVINVEKMTCKEAARRLAMQNPYIWCENVNEVWFVVFEGYWKLEFPAAMIPTPVGSPTSAPEPVITPKLMQVCVVIDAADGTGRSVTSACQ